MIASDSKYPPEDNDKYDKPSCEFKCHLSLQQVEWYYIILLVSSPIYTQRGMHCACANLIICGVKLHKCELIKVYKQMHYVNKVL